MPDHTTYLQYLLDEGYRLPPGEFTTTAPLVVSRDVSGWGMNRTTIRNRDSDVFAFVDGAAVEVSNLQAIAHRGHVFEASDLSVTFCEWRRLSLACLSPQHSIFHMEGGNFIDNRVSMVSLTLTPAHQVPGWFVSSPNGAANSNTFERGRVTYSGEYAFHIESTTAQSYANDNIFRDWTFEVTMGGNIRLLSCRNSLIEQCNTYDLGTPTTRDLYYLGKTASAPKSVSNVLRQVERRGGTLGSGLADIRASVGSTRTTIERCSGRIDLAGTTGCSLVDVLPGLSPTTEVVSPGGDLVYVGRRPAIA